MKTKKLLALLLTVSIILTAGPFDIFIDIFAGLSPYNHDYYGKGTYSDPADYRQIHKDIFDNNNGAVAPTAKFSVVNKADNSVIGTSSAGDTVIIVDDIPVGTVIKINNLSSKGSGNYIDMVDFQVTKDNSQVSSIQAAPSSLNSYELTLSSTGTYKFYLCVRDNLDKTKTDNWGNWSYNGAHVAKGLNYGFNGSKETTGTPETAGGDDFWGLWYFAQVVVKVEKNPPVPDFTISYKESDVTDNKTNPAIIDPSDKSLVLVDRSRPYSASDPITGRKWYYWDISSGWKSIAGSDDKTTVDIADMDTTLAGSGINKAFKLVCTSSTGGEAYKEHTAYFKAAPPPPAPGKADIFIYYLDKSSGADVAPPDLTTYRGVDYGIYTITAQAVSGYTLDASTPSPQTVTVNAADNSKTVTFLYNPQGGGGEPDNEPPVAIITGPREELAGANCKLDGRKSYDRDGEIVQYIWETPGGTVSQTGNGFIVVWYPYDGNYIRTEYVKLTVIDDSGASDTTEAAIDILPPVPTAVLNIAGTFRENRKVTLDASGSISPSRYPINSYLWTISNSANVRSVAALNGNAKNDVIYKAAGTYSNKVEVKNTVGLSDYETKSITIVPDQNPTANFSAIVKLLRNPADSAKNATITVSNLCSSPDSDPIKATVMFYAYDSDNDGSFDDETWYYSVNGTTWLSSGLTYAQLKAGSFDIYARGTGNPSTFTLKTNQVGKYKLEAMTIENIPAADTIPSLITAADYRRNNTFTSKPDSEKIVEVMNTAPTITFEAKKKKEVDILIATDYTGQQLANLQAALNVQKATLLAKNIDVKCTIVNTTAPVAHVNDAKFWYRRYARYFFTGDRESYNGSGGGTSKDDERFEIDELWEERQALESEAPYLPPRPYRNLTWSKSGELYEEEDDPDPNWYRRYHNITVNVTNDGYKNSGVIKFVKESIRGLSSSSEYVSGYEYSDIQRESVSLDSSFVKEEKIEDTTLNVNSVNFSSLTSTPLRAGSDRYLLFIGDSSSKIYSEGWGNHFPFGGLTKTEQDYIKNNNIKPYIVAPQTTLDTVIGAEKAKEVYVGTIPYFKTPDGAYWTILDNYPVMLNLEGEIQEIYGEYILLTNGTLKYRVGGAGFATVVTGVTKVIKEKDTNGQINNNIWVVTSNGKLRQCLNGAITMTLDYPNALDVFRNNGLAYGDGTYTISCTDGTYFRYKNGTVLKVSNYSLHNVTGINIYDQEIDYTAEYGCLFVYTNGVVQLGVLWHGSIWNSERRTYDYYIEKVTLKSLYRGVWDDEDRMYYASGSFPTVKIIDDGRFIVNGNVNTGLTVGLDYSGTYQRYFGLASEPQNIINYKDGIETYTDGTLGVPFKSYYAYTTSNDKDRSGYITTLWDVPELHGKTIVKAYVTECVTIILTSDNCLYGWVDMRNYGRGGHPTVCGLTLLTNNAGAFVKGTAGYYHDKNDGTVRKIADKSIIFSNVVDAKSNGENTTVYTVTKDGALHSGTSTANMIKTRLIINDTTKQYIPLRNILNDISSTKYFAAGQYAAAVQDITNIYLNDTSYTTNYILVNDEMNFTTAYSDYENDPKSAEEWRFLHEPYYFDNSMGIAPFHGQTLTSPVTKYTKKGRYTINLRARDNPKNDVRFKNDTDEAYNYYKWSTGSQNVLLYVHEKPIALARVTITGNGNGTYTVKAFDAGSYDPDHSNSRADKGIAAREWRWREASSAAWTNGQMNKTSCTADKSYIIQLRVKDIEGVWSDYYTITIDEDNPPVALFSLDKTLISSSELLKVKDQSFPQSFSTITTWHWVVKKLNADGSAPAANLQNQQFTSSNNGTGALAGYDANVKTNYSANGVGTFRVYLRVKDSNGLWSDGGTDSTAPADLSKYYSVDFDVDKAPVPSFTVANSLIKPTDILKVRDTTTTTGISGIAKWHWVVKKLNADGSVPGTSLQSAIFTNSNAGTGALAGYDSNVITDYSAYGTGTYRIYLRACNGNGMWSDEGTDAAFTLGSFFYRDIIVDSPPTASFTIAQNPIEPAEKLKLRDTSAVTGVSPIDRWHWIVKKLNPDGSVPAASLQDMQYSTHNAGTGELAGCDVNVKTDYSDSGPGTYRIYLRVRNANGMWSDGGNDRACNPDNFFQRELLVRESFKISNLRVVKVRDLHLERFYYNPSTGQYDDRPMDVNSMAVDRHNFGEMVEGLTKGYSFEFEIDTVNFNGNNDAIVITPHFYTCGSYGRDPEERELYWENSYHEILKAGEGGHEAWADIRLGKESRSIKDANKATWRGSYLIPGTAWAVPMGTTAENAVSKRINKDIIVSFEIKGYKDGVMKYDYNLKQWPAERTTVKQPYEIGDVIRYDYTKCNLDDNKVILNRP